MKDKIFELRKKGYTYNQIVEELNCSKGTISYHLGEGQKEKTYKRNKNWKYKTINHKVWSFTNEETLKLRRSGGEFGRNKDHKGSSKQLFGYKDVLNKFGRYTKCYISGEDIDLIEGDYAFDHIVPRSKGGFNTLKNLGITTKKINFMKHDLLLEEFIKLCIKILKFNGYKITKL